MSRYADYDPFAWLYSTRWGSEYHDQAWTVLEKLLFKRVPPGAAVLDLCCGDGRLTSVLRRKGYRVCGVDGSEEMLGFARQRCPDVEFLLADARTFELDGRFDAVISTFDALNHVTSPGELAVVCRNVERVLNPGGYFAFDINREEAYQELWPQTYAQIEPELVSVCTGSYTPAARIAVCAITMFRLVDGNWRRSDFHLTQYAHRKDDVINSLYASGFADAECFDAAADLGMYGNIGRGRSYFLARRGIQLEP